MHKLMVMYPQPDDPHAFLEYYTKKHVPLADKLPGLVRASFGQPKMLTKDQSWFLIWEGEFKSYTDLIGALKSEVGAQVSADVPNYSPKGATMLFVEMPGAA
jgi:uncharacterized protein (TIGR02118 family)